VSLKQFVESTEGRDVSLIVVNREAPRPLRTMLEGLFEHQPVDVREASDPDEDDDVVHLVEDGEVRASSPLGELEEAILLVNSDLYITGARGLDEVGLPAVVEALEGVRFDLRGYPESHKEKLLLVLVSRYIERLSLEGDGGKHRASFQRLSRMDDERGTRTVYERLTAAGTDVHVYGVPDWTPPPEFGLTMHGGWSEEFRTSWFVVHVPETDDGRHSALVAVETSPGSWDGVWTFDPDRVRSINAYVEREL
jgi:hypothetical protein